VFAVFWATDESDPERFVEGWLDSHAYRAFDSWYGNVRLAVYAVPERVASAPDRVLDVDLHHVETGDEITLVGYSLLDDRLAAGDIVQITLFWRVDQTPSRRYKAFIHLLDEGNHIVGQRDAEPQGGALLTTLWAPGKLIIDNYGVPIHPATPPGTCRVEVGMYDMETGQRLTTQNGESEVWLKPLGVARPSALVPVTTLAMQHAGGASFGKLALLGYDVYRLGSAHQTDAPLRPGDILHIDLYWQAKEKPNSDWGVALDLADSEGQEAVSIAGEPVGGYPTSLWQAGDIWRGQFDLSLPGDMEPGWYRFRVLPQPPSGAVPDVFWSEPLQVGP
jgi:hypothetical protein